MNIIPDFQTAQEFYGRLPDWARQEVSTSVERFAYIMGALDQFHPTNMVEVGVSAGTLSAALLYKARKYSERPILHGIDLGTACYFNGSRRVGELLETAFPDLLPYFRLHTGKTSLDASELLDSNIDFAYIDANHSHPWAAIDCLCILPHLADGAIIGFHDTARVIARANSGVFTFRSLDAEKTFSDELDVHGTGFALYNKNNLDSILRSLSRSLMLPWQTTIQPAQIKRVSELVEAAFTQEHAARIKEILQFWGEHAELVLSLEQRREKDLLDAIYASTSWRVTAPLRWLKGRVNI